MIKDRNIGYKYKTEFMSAYTFNYYELATHIKGTIGGASKLAEIGALGVVGVKPVNADEFARLTFPVPSYWDTENKIFVRCLWSDNGTALTAGMEVTWAVWYQEKAFSTAPVAGSGAGNATALDDPIAADAHTGVADVIHATQWGMINAGQIALATDYLTVDVELAVDANDMDPVLVGIEWAYLPKLTSGTQASDQADPTDA
jgi:hypothetical protein